uniref:Uncharacterized protein n=1 Tax=Lotharella globosa TaxID=91324 RepID=A0A7S4E010_9EUKA
MAAPVGPWMEPRRRRRGRNRRAMHIDEPKQENQLNLEDFGSGDAKALIRSNKDLEQYCRRLWGCNMERWPPAHLWPLLLGKILEACIANKPWPLSAVETGGVPWRIVLEMKQGERKHKIHNDGSTEKLEICPSDILKSGDCGVAMADAAAAADNKSNNGGGTDSSHAVAEIEDDDDGGSWVLMDEGGEDGDNDSENEWVIMNVSSDSEGDLRRGKPERAVEEAILGTPVDVVEPATTCNGENRTGLLDRMHSSAVFPAFCSFLGPKELASLEICFRGSGKDAIGNALWQQAFRRDFFANAKAKRRKRGKKGKRALRPDYWKQRYRANMPRR